MAISLIISGNLTGFSRFYTSPNANDVCNQAKIDFDYRNYVTFLEGEKKVYAISFSPKIIAVSLVTRILDSFRRPGILDVTVLIPRNHIVCNQRNQADKTALFKLLNEVNDRFHEKNFLSGMVNQNPSVLMQEYYADILSKYTLTSDKGQRAINADIDETLRDKRIGYVAAADRDIPQYLSSLMRKSYEGYHHVFFASNAPQNIEEAPEELITYRVKIENANAPMQRGEVKLIDKIPSLRPAQGEKDIPNKNFTYGQVIAREAEPDIIGRFEGGDTIVLNYRFPQEERTLNFRFSDGTNDLTIGQINPILEEANGKQISIYSDSYTFRGKEIYIPKIIKSGNPEFTIVSPGVRLDLTRFQNNATITFTVKRGWEWEFNPQVMSPGVIIKPLNITLRHKFSGECKKFTNVTRGMKVTLTGNRSDWELQITSDYYEDVTLPLDAPYELKKKKPQPEPKPQPVKPKVITTPSGNNPEPTYPISTDEPATIIEASTKEEVVRRQREAERIAEEEATEKRLKIKRLTTYGILSVLVLLLVGLLAWIFWPSEPSPTNLEEKEVVLAVIDQNGVTIKSEELLNLLDIKAKAEGKMKIENNNDLSYTLSFPKDKEASFVVTVSLADKDDIQFFDKRITKENLKDTIPIKLPVLSEDLLTYLQLKNNEKTDKNPEDIIKRLKNRVTIKPHLPIFWHYIYTENLQLRLLRNPNLRLLPTMIKTNKKNM